MESLVERYNHDVQLVDKGTEQITALEEKMAASLCITEHNGMQQCLCMMEAMHAYRKATTRQSPHRRVDRSQPANSVRKYDQPRPMTHAVCGAAKPCFNAATARRLCQRCKM
jgi:hypothetical protein